MCTPGEERSIEIRIVGLVGAGKSAAMSFLQDLAAVTVHDSKAPRMTLEHTIRSAGGTLVEITAWDLDPESGEGCSDLARRFGLGAHRDREGPDGVIFMIDSSEDGEEHWQSNRGALTKFLSCLPSSTVPVMVSANKRDKEGCVSVMEVSKRLGLADMRSRDWCIHRTCSTTGEGLLNGLSWLTTQARQRADAAGRLEEKMRHNIDADEVETGPWDASLNYRVSVAPSTYSTGPGSTTGLQRHRLVNLEPGGDMPWVDF